MTYYGRRAWGARPAKGGPGRADVDDVEGIVLHWPAITKKVRGVESVKRALRGWQDYHMDDRGWSDIAYQEAIDQDGNVYGLRNLHTQPGANGDTSANQRYGALLLILAPGEEPTPAMIRAVRRRVKRHRVIAPKARRIRGHSEVRPEPTSCPGPIVQRLIRAGTFDPSNPYRSPK
ncbi:MAG TPA: N-acetylmuramoyl-L-alanine amidase [Nocardioides sp.]|uniref:peptidoglycan recognition protein family protein n=1 Tax=Nocardioides sp. TaxID=35761 RepID=UPI002CD999EC|nr:N-acetylmuramoyl-L-alanine amidase [Nocardioides sp.]HTW15129.1 N-acetylmuramoyl-L-alanine amidase [Nocardioides sp.]